MPELGPARVSQGLWGMGRIDEGLPFAADVSSGFGWRLLEGALANVGLSVDGRDVNGRPLNFHTGIDLPAPEGTPILAPAPFDVVFQRTSPAEGNAVYGRFVDGRGCMFLHMQLGKPMAGVGARVRRGDIVGFVGTTGHSTGNHLHFSMMSSVLNGEAFYARELFIDPWPFFRATITDDGTTVTASTLEDRGSSDDTVASFIANSLRALASNPPPDWPQALLELARRAEYLRGLIAQQQH